jgi:hypothetical protein
MAQSSATAANDHGCSLSLPDRTLLVGVVSWDSAGNRARRQQIRELCSTRAGEADLRFVLPASSAPATTSYPSEDGVLRLALPPTSYHPTTGKLHLVHAFLRHAVSCAAGARYAFVGRLDDDALVNASFIAALLRPFATPIDASPRRSDSLWSGSTIENATRLAESTPWIVLGNFERAWYAWNEDSLKPVCWSHSPRLVKHVRKQWAAKRGVALGSSAYDAARANASTSPPECVTAAGPFPYARGPFVAYSRAVARLLLSAPMTTAAERRVDTLPRYAAVNKAAPVFLEDVFDA